ncbi:MAG: hypothetical protein A2031_06785 [Deltaproteobacteria bacterium RBG_19FT_COMBO_43_11]|nr:MAG: hypothetical protein A2W27_10880 [Deltaproteobacteria bacterium RBG_16_44_11]OGP88324.1 MAG: hypothetical protein A2031_06785 [Deltaproteobacteria bacterium RBG_19FT_COMBO_43_11]
MENGQLKIDDYVKTFADFIGAWNRSDPEAVASYYADDFDYRDPSTREGITNKEQLIKYLKLMFLIWPQQEWIPGDLFPHKQDGSFSGCYNFKISNGKTEIKGHGMDIIEFKGNKICKNHIYLNADKWNTWLKNELSESK